MTREERRALLGDDVIAQIQERVDLAPDPSPELVEELRRIWTGGRVPRPRSSQTAGAESDAA